MHLIADPTCSVGLLHNKNSLDSYRGSSAHTTTTSTVAVVATTITTKSTGQQLQQQLQLLQPVADIVKNQQQYNDVPIIANLIAEKQQQLQENNNNIIQNNLEQIGTKITQQQQQSYTPPVSSILRAQLDEFKHLPQPLGSNLLSSNEQHICKVFNLSPTTYLSLKTVMLSGAPVSSNMSPVENSVRKYFIKAGWLSH